MTTSDRGGSVRSTFFRLCVRAPLIMIWPRFELSPGVCTSPPNRSGSPGRSRSAGQKPLSRRRSNCHLFCETLNSTWYCTLAESLNLDRWYLCYFVGALPVGDSGVVRPSPPRLGTKRGLCQSVCL